MNFAQASAWALLAGLVACGTESSRGAPEGGLPALPGECGGNLRCAEGQGCFERRCVQLCTGDQHCAPREYCALEGSATGLCVPGDQPPPQDPCAGKLCLSPTASCHPLTGSCVACSEGRECPPGSPVCDRGRGLCVAQTGELCAPCNADADCVDSSDASAALKCVATDVTFERTCVPACSAENACPAGFVCSPARKVCVPRRGTCTSYRHAIAATACAEAADCSALGVAAHSGDEGTCVAGRCALGCEQTSDCPGVLVCSELSCRAPQDADGPDGGGGSSSPGEGGV